MLLLKIFSGILLFPGTFLKLLWSYIVKRKFSFKIKVVVKLKKEDNEIIEKLLCRDQQALADTDEKYGALCRKLAFGILDDYEDVKECVNTSYFKLWNAVPPAKPQSLKAYLCKIVRSVAFSMRKKSCSSEMYLTELSELFPDDNNNAENQLDSEMLTIYLNEFLALQKDINRRTFILRYYYNLSVEEISLATGLKNSTVKTKLFRTREELKKLLQSKGYKI